MVCRLYESMRVVANKVIYIIYQVLAYCNAFAKKTEYFKVIKILII